MKPEGMGTFEYFLRRARVPFGFLFAAAFLVFARPNLRSLAASLTLVIPGLALRAWAAGFVKKNSELTTSGPYAHTRNPLYLGSFFAALGLVASSRNIVLVLCFTALFFAIYLPVIRSEERFLTTHFSGFPAYMQRVPRFFPRRGRLTRNGPGTFSAAQFRHHREYNASMGAAAIYAALLLLLFLRAHGTVPQ